MEALRVITNPEELGQLVHHLGNMAQPFHCVTKPGKPEPKRSLNQNALFHKWMQEIADHFGDVDAHDMKGICHREYGLGIRLKDEKFAWVWDQTGAKLPYEKQCSLLASGVLNLSSGMSKPDLKRYMDTIERVFRAKGVRLTIPEDRT